MKHKKGGGIMKKTYTNPKVEVIIFASTNNTNDVNPLSSVNAAAKGPTAGTGNLKHIGINDLNK